MPVRPMGFAEEALEAKAAVRRALAPANEMVKQASVGAVAFGSLEDMVAPRAAVVGIGVGEYELRRLREPGTFRMLVPFVYHRSAEGMERFLRGALADAGLSRQLVVMRSASQPVALATRRWRPVIPGTSTGHARVSAGTLGAVVKRNQEQFFLSNEHVFAPVGAQAGDAALQPGPVDGGRNPGDHCGRLAASSGMVVGRPNLVDAALVEPTAACRLAQWGVVPVRKSFLGSDVDLVGKVVRKLGSTTGLTLGIVEAVGVDVDDINYGTPFAPSLFSFEEQVVVRGIGQSFSAGGDSGSLVWSDDTRLPGVRQSRSVGVGLLFAGAAATGETYVNPWRAVNALMGVDLA